MTDKHLYMTKDGGLIKKQFQLRHTIPLFLILEACVSPYADNVVIIRTDGKDYLLVFERKTEVIVG